MIDQFIPYKLAAKLKGLRFKERCVCYYEDKKLKLYNDLSGWDFNTSFTTCVSAPTWQQSFDWFNSKGFNFSSCFDGELDKYWIDLWKWDEENKWNQFIYESEPIYLYRELNQVLLEKLIEQHEIK